MSTLASMSTPVEGTQGESVQAPAHALISISGASRWLACPPSVRLAEDFPESESAAAKEGTLAHAIAEHMLKAALGWITVDEFHAAFDEFAASPHYTPDMPNKLELYTNYVLGQYGKALDEDPNAIIVLEAKLDLGHVIPEGFGTCDAGIIYSGSVEAIDLKYGKYLVEAENNPQLKLYCEGLRQAYCENIEVFVFKQTIVQPRLDSILSAEVMADDLAEWVRDAVVPAAKAAFEGSGQFCPGSHCKFCKAKVRCKTLAAKMVESTRTNRDALSDKELLKLFEYIPTIAAWAKELKAYMEDLASKGYKWPGYELAQGLGNRDWANEAEAAAVLKELIPEDKLYVKELISPTKAETILTKSKFKAYSHLVVRPKTAASLKPSFEANADKHTEMADDFGDDFIANLTTI